MPKQKKSQGWSCPVCNKCAGKGTFACIQCRMWVHPRCGGYTRKDLSKAVLTSLRCNNCKVDKVSTILFIYISFSYYFFEYLGSRKLHVQRERERLSHILLSFLLLFSFIGFILHFTYADKTHPYACPCLRVKTMFVFLQI